MKRYLYLFIYIVVVNFFTACSSSWDEQFEPTPFEAMPSASLIVSSDFLEFSQNGSEEQFAINTPTYWTARTTANWVHLSSTMGKGNATMAVTTEPNLSSTQTRNAVINISNGIDNLSVSVTQSGVLPPSITHVNVSNLTKYTATLSFSFSSVHVDITEYGVCYSSSTNTPSKDNAATVGQQSDVRSGDFSIAISGLKSKTTYYARAYIVSSLGIQYGETTQFTTPASLPNESDNGTPKD